MRSFDLSDFLLQRFDKNSAVPSNRQLYRLLRQAILEGVLPADTRLPSSRDLADDLQVSRNTVLYAYEQLRAEAYLEGRSGSGTFVSNVLPDTVLLETHHLSNKALPKLVAKEGALALSQRGQQLIKHAGAASQQWGAFVPGVPDVSAFPHRIWRDLQAKVWRNPPPESMTYASGAGYQALRVQIAGYLRLARSVDCESNQIVITNGSHQSIDLCLRLLSDNGDLAWLENPCYWGARNIVQAAGLQIRPIALDAEGICPNADDLQAVPRFILVTPSHQYPLGMVMSLARREMLLAYAHEHNSWIIEDDYDSEFRYHGKPLISLQGMDRGKRVIYMGTFSKTLFPGLRLGYLVLPKELVNAFVTGMEELHRSGQVSVQATLAEFMAQGFFTSHIRTMRSRYAARLDILQEEIANRFDPQQVQAMGSDAGLHLVLGLPNTCDDRAVMLNAAEAGIAVRALSRYYAAPENSQRGLVLGYGGVQEHEIAPAFDRLAQVIERHLK